MKVRVGGIIRNENKILLLKYSYSSQTVWNIPGGNVDKDEPLAEALKREFQEELQVQIEVGEVLHVAEVFVQQKMKLHIFFEVKILQGTPKLNPLETSAEAFEWIALNELPELNIYPNIPFGSPNVYLGRIDQKWF